MFLLLPSLHFTTDNRKSFPQKYYLPLGYTLKQKLVRPQASPGSKIALQPSVHLLILLLIQQKSNYLSLSLLIRFVLQKSMLCMVILYYKKVGVGVYLQLFRTFNQKKKYCCSVKVVITQPIFHSNTNKTCHFCPFPPKQCHKNWTCFK